MTKDRIEEILNGILDELAALEHERWSHWQRYMHDKGQVQEDGSLLISAEFIKRWEKQIATPYADLSETEKESDRDQVRRYLPIIADRLAKGA